MYLSMHLAIFLSINQVCFETGDYVILKMDVEGAEWPGSKAEILQTARFFTHQKLNHFTID